MSQKKYSINWENEEPVSFEVDGVLYDSLDQVPDEADREKLASMMDGSLEQQFEEEFKKDFEANKKNAASLEKLILVIFSGVAALMLLIAAISSFHAVSKLRAEASAPGRVVDMVTQRQYINEQDRIVRDYYYPVVEFTSADGRRHSAQMAEGSQRPSYEVGDDVIVRYDPHHPLEARIQSPDSAASLWILPGITGVLGLGFLGAVLAIRKFMSPAAADELA